MTSDLSTFSYRLIVVFNCFLPSGCLLYLIVNHKQSRVTSTQRLHIHQKANEKPLDELPCWKIRTQQQPQVLLTINPGLFLFFLFFNFLLTAARQRQIREGNFFFISANPPHRATSVHPRENAESKGGVHEFEGFFC